MLICSYAYEQTGTPVIPLTFYGVTKLGQICVVSWPCLHIVHCQSLSCMYPFFLLLRSESPSQVFIIVLSWLCVVLKNINPANWSNIFLAYDNMCHLDGLRAAKNLLPWCSLWDKAWMSVKKIIDRLHISNHKDKKCKEKYDPSTLKEEIPNGNTMAAEQTFVWLSRFKKNLCAMPKVHHLFFLHRMVKHRNNYTVRCYKNGRKPLLPKARGKLC